ncbi:membrane protein [Spirochaetia bacterium]|nr:membrane protein [Spirochaetia bacterium]
MNITREENLQKNEAVIYSPELHWIFLIRPILLLTLDVVLLLVKETSAALIGSGAFWDTVCSIYKYLIITIFLLALFYLFWTIIEFFLVQYCFTNKRLIIKKGLFFSVLVDIPIDKVESIMCVQSLSGRIFDYGTIVVSGTGGRRPRCSTIQKPHKARRILYDIIDKNKEISIM